MVDNQGLGALMARTLTLRDDRGERRVSIDLEGEVIVDGAAVRVARDGAGIVRVGHDASHAAWVAAAGDVRWVYLDGEVFEIEVVRAGARRRAGSGHASLAAPMPATVVRVDAAPGDPVRRGDTLIILEAMKMELPIRAPSDGIVKAIHCGPGDLVQPGTALVEIE